MKVQLIASLSGTRNGVEWPRPGSMIDLPDEEATQLILNRLARIPSVEEHATKAAKSERATRPRKGLTTKDV